jgi:hypothetical protein
MHGDLTGPPPLQSIQDNTYILSVYYYDSNSFFAEPKKQRTDAETVKHISSATGPSCQTHTENTDDEHPWHSNGVSISYT